jgi:hypothetical protein
MQSRHAQALTQGVICGLIGYGTVAILMAMMNVLAGRSPFFTAAAFGGALFYGLTDLASLRIWVGPVLAYNGFHLLVFLVLGIVSTFVTLWVERKPVFFYLALNGFLIVGFLVFGGFLMFTQTIREAISPWALLTVSLIAAAAMAAYLLVTHRLLRRELRDLEV